MRRVTLMFVLLLCVAGSNVAWAHEVRPGYLELRQTGPEIYDVLWKVPARGDLRLGLYVKLPENCQSTTPIARYRAQGAFLERWTIRCAGMLTGKTVGIDGLSTTLTDVLVRVEQTDGTTQVERLTPDSSSVIIQAAPSRAQVAGTYLRLGIEHILGGIDHLLFVLALLLIVKGRWQLLKTITAFTVAHSITLAAATLGFVHVPQQPVEAVIALSIVFLAADIVRVRSGQTSLTQRWPWTIAFTFGLLHGFGFAGALSEIGLPEQAIPVALLFFNVGVELGQLLFVAGVMVLGALVRRIAVPLPTWATRLPAHGIGAVAAFWTIERVARFWS